MSFCLFCHEAAQLLDLSVFRFARHMFHYEGWLSPETSLEVNLKSVIQGETVQFESRFFNQARSRLSENHMWMSILYRPMSSSFTRVERASCALAYILLTMVSNAMYYDTGSDYELPALLEVGPFRFTSSQVTSIWTFLLNLHVGLDYLRHVRHSCFVYFIAKSWT